MNILILGATGMIGSRITTEARERGHTVTAASRNGEVKVDANNVEALTRALHGQDALVVAIAPSLTDPSAPALVDTYQKIIQAAAQTGVRVLFVGGAGSLDIAPGKRLLDTPEFPEAYKAESLQAADALDDLRANHTQGSLNWVYFSPAAMIAPGERTTQYRLGKNELVAGAQGSSISAEDFAHAALNELEHPQHHNERFTIGY